MPINDRLDRLINGYFASYITVKKLGILGSTGSIGTQTLDVIDAIDSEFEIVYGDTVINTNEFTGTKILFKYTYKLS